MSNIRDNIRAGIFSAESKKRKTQKVIFYGQEIELRQPTAGNILDHIENPDRKLTMVQFLIDYAYVPGTDDKVFEEADSEGLRSLPYTADMKKLNAVMDSFTDILVGDAEKN